MIANGSDGSNGELASQTPATMPSAPWTAEHLSKRIAPAWGTPLSDQDYANLAKSWITPEIADAALLRRVTSLEGQEIVGQKGKRDCAGILIPSYWADDVSAFNYRIRRDKPEWTAGKDGRRKTERKYLGPPNGANRLYIPPGVTLAQLANTQIPIALVEGEKKALALWRLANHEVDLARFIPIAISGVWNWLGRIGKTGGSNGERLDVKGPIGDLSRITWNERRTFIVFDSNVHTNESVKVARRGICRELATRGAKVDFVNLPEDCGVNGIDDLLAAWGPAKVLQLFEASTSGARLDVVQPPQFRSRPEGLFRITAKAASLTQTQLTNYQAEITADIRLDDGVETKREFEIAAELFGERSRFSISASEFASMDWAIERLGPLAITYPNQRDHTRTAIQSLSLSAAKRSIYTHTGWRNLGDRWVFLHARGATGTAGRNADIEVRLSGQMSRYELITSASAEALATAVRASLKIIELGPDSITLPLLAAPYRAVFGGADFGMHLVGPTGVFKSELAALLQQHYGKEMDRLHLPGSWSSTGNALEVFAFAAKDVLFVVDDFAPHGNRMDVSRYHATAERIFRAAGNHAGRSRLDSSTKLREPKPPRALILSTGEEIPRGQSVQARLLILEISKGDIDVGRLTECQRYGASGVYATAMGGFVQWLANRYDESTNAFKAKVEIYREKAIVAGMHARTPESIASLQAAFELSLEHAVNIRAIATDEAGRLSERSWNALRKVAAAQARHQGEAEPTVRFLNLLRSILSSGQAHLANREGGEPEHRGRACGWWAGTHGIQPQGDCVGWVDGHDVYLDPESTYRVVQAAASASGDAFPVSESTLRKRLRDKGLLASLDKKRETLTVRRTICGSSKDVLHFRRSTVLPEAVEDGPKDVE